MTKVGVIGAGQMGSGIAQTAAQFGHEVLLGDIDLAVAEKAKAGIAKGLARLVEKDKMTAADAEALLARIVPVGDTAPMTEAEFIIEAATEREDIKHRIFEGLAKVLGPAHRAHDVLFSSAILKKTGLRLRQPTA